MTLDKDIRKALDNCASYNATDCIFDHPCHILQGKRCAWFEQAVLADPNMQSARLKYGIAYLEK